MITFYNNLFCFSNLSISQTSSGTRLFQKKPLGRRWHLMSGAVTRREFSTITSGTERKRDFVGIVLFLSEISVKTTYFFFLFFLYIILTIIPTPIAPAHAINRKGSGSVFFSNIKNSPISSISKIK